MNHVWKDVIAGKHSDENPCLDSPSTQGQGIKPIASFQQHPSVFHWVLPIKEGGEAVFVCVAAAESQLYLAQSRQAHKATLQPSTSKQAP